MELSAKHEAFAQRVASGESAAAAYRATYPKASTPSAQTLGPEMLRNPQVSFRVKELRKAVREIALREFALTTTQILRYCLEVLETPAGQVTPRHKLCQEYTVGKTGVRVKMPGKLEAAEKIIKMMGWNEPEEVTVNPGVSPEAVEEFNRIFGKPRGKD